MLTLALDASTYVGSVAVLRGEAIVAEREVAMRGRDAERLMPAVAGALESANVAPADLSRIVCGGGPGSFTSLRIAGAIAKGIALAAERPLFAVPSLLLMAAAARPTLRAGRYLAALDAMRDESYVAEIELSQDGGGWRVGGLRLVPSEAVDEIASASSASTLGAGRSAEAQPHARGVARLTEWLAAALPVDLASWEPVYGRLAEAQVKWEAAHGRVLPGG